MKTTLQKAIEKMTENPGNGDICKKTNGLDCGFMINQTCQVVTSRDGIKPYPFESVDFYGDKWEIIRAEPEVLTVEQIYKNHFIDDYDITPAIGESTRRLLSSVDKNGQIKEWKRLKPLIDAAERIRGIFATHNRIHNPQDFPFDLWSKLDESLKNLTPPWEPEK